MDIESVKELKKALERDMAEAIKTFEVRTGMAVSNVLLLHENSISASKPRVIAVRVSVEL